MIPELERESAALFDCFRICPSFACYSFDRSMSESRVRMRRLSALLFAETWTSSAVASWEFLKLFGTTVFLLFFSIDFFFLSSFLGPISVKRLGVEVF